MNRNEYLDRLARELASRNVSNIMDIMSDFNAHFEEAVSAGQSEDEICEMLGDPAEIAEQCVEEYSRQQHHIEGEEIYVNLTSANLVFESTNAAELDVRIERHGLVIDYGQWENEFNIERTGGSLRVTQIRHNSLAAWLFGMIDIKTVFIGVPQGFHGTVQAKVVSGNVTLSGPMKVKALSSDVTSGNIKIGGLTGEEISLKTRSGNIKTEMCTGALVANGFSGNISIVSHHGNVSAESQSGNVSVETDIINTDSLMGTKSGGVKLKLERLDADLQLKCVSGNISFTVMSLHGNITGKTVSGCVTGHLTSDTKADFRLNSSGANNEFEDHIGSNGLPCVTLSSRSGTVKVKKI